jgi:hypothetical protein
MPNQTSLPRKVATTSERLATFAERSDQHRGFGLVIQKAFIFP